VSTPSAPGPAAVAWLVVAHGSRNPDLVSAHAEVCEAIAARVGTRATVGPAYLELTDPSIPDAVDEAVAGGATHVVLVPYFLHVGNHTVRDLPAILDDARHRHPHVRLALAQHLGFDERLVDVAIDRATAAEADTQPPDLR
jgi:sirohydrochlorin ferrochelatase